MTQHTRRFIRCFWGLDAELAGARVLAKKTIEALENGFHAAKLPKSNATYSDAIKYCVEKGLVNDNVAQALLGNSEIAELKKQMDQNGWTI